MIKDSSDAKRLAAEGESVRRDLKNRKSYMNILSVKDFAEKIDPEEKSADPDEPPDFDKEEEKDIAAALPSSTSVRRGASGVQRSKGNHEVFQLQWIQTLPSRLP